MGVTEREVCLDEIWIESERIGRQVFGALANLRRELVTQQPACGQRVAQCGERPGVPVWHW